MKRNKYNSSGKLIEQWEEVNYSKKICLDSKQSFSISYGPREIYVTCTITKDNNSNDYSSFHNLEDENKMWDDLANWIERNI